MIALYIILGILGGAVGIIVLHALFLCVITAFIKNRDYDKVNKFYRAVFWYFIRVAMFFSHVKIVATGKEKLENIKGKFLLVSNHRSNYDPFITALGLNLKDAAFISKPENFKVPFFGKISRKCMYTSIDRENAKNALKTINRTADLIKKGVISFCVYPEGTRSRGEELLPFHDGVFKIAQKAGAPVVVAIVRGTDLIHKNAPWKKTKVFVDVLEVIGAEEVVSQSSHELGDRVREKMTDALSV